MPDYVKKADVLLVGTGYMAREHVKVLRAQNVSFCVVGRSKVGARKFSQETGVDAACGGIDSWIEQNGNNLPKTAIVAVQAELAFDCVKSLLQCGVKRLLVEKPCGLTVEHANILARLVGENNAKIVTAYNRRFYSSVFAAEKIIEEDGGVSSFNFEITEYKFNPEKQDVPGWFIGNDTHVIDLAFFLGGEPQKICSITKNTCGTGMPDSDAVFAGCGFTKDKIPFSYFGDWLAPGRWGVEILTKAHRLIFRPMEKLHIQHIGSFAISEVEIDDSLDKQYKPGIYREVECFLNDIDNKRFLTIAQQAEHMKYYFEMLNGNIECV